MRYENKNERSIDPFEETRQSHPKMSKYNKNTAEIELQNETAYIPVDQKESPFKEKENVTLNAPPKNDYQHQRPNMVQSPNFHIPEPISFNNQSQGAYQQQRNYDPNQTQPLMNYPNQTMGMNFKYFE